MEIFTESSETALYFGLFFLMGICFGSFVTMASHRLPHGADIVRHRSHCPLCHSPLGVLDLIPLLSWMIRGGHCRYCGGRVSIRYPLIELALGIAFCLIYFGYGMNWQSIVFCLFTAALLTLIVADFETTLIPDEVHLFLIPLGIVHHILFGSPWQDVIATTLLAGFSGLLLHYGYYWLRGRHGLGFGDVKFLAVVGLWLGNPLSFVPFLCFSGLFGIVTGLLWRFVSSDPRFPFGPALASSLALIVLYPPSTQFFWHSLSRLHGIM